MDCVSFNKIFFFKCFTRVILACCKKKEKEKRKKEKDAFENLPLNPGGGVCDQSAGYG